MISNITYDKESEKQNQLRKEMAKNYRIEQALKEEIIKKDEILEEYKTKDIKIKDLEEENKNLILVMV